MSLRIVKGCGLAALLLSAALLSGTPALAQTRGIGVVPVTTRQGQRVELYQGSYALLVGVSDYTAGWPDLESIPGELDRLQNALERQGFSVTRVMNPDSRGIKRAFEDFIDKYGYDQENRLLFFYSGHGYTRKLGRRQKGYLVPADAPNPIKDEKGFARKALTMSRVQTWAREIEAKHALFLFDSCFSGTIFQSRALPIPRHISDKTARPVRQFITAGSAGEEVPAKSVFLPSFIRAIEGEGDINGDGYVTGTELGQFLHEKVLGYNAGQTPQYGKIKDPALDEGDFVFPLPRAKPKPAVAAAVPQPAAPLTLNAEEEFWKAVRDSKDKAMYKAYLNDYPQGRFASLARVKIKQLEKLSEAPRTAKLSPTPRPVTVTARPSPVQAPPGMVRIEGGEFRMGGDGEPVQTVRLSGFLIDESEVTQAAFQQATGFNPSKHGGADNPVDNVSWHKAKEYCEKVAKRLPTEAEWEYAARGGTTTKYFFGDYGSLLPNFANLCGAKCLWGPHSQNLERDGNLEVAPVKSLEPNPWGLYDVYGNVAEWVSDWYGPYRGGSRENPTGPPDGALKVLRGGSWSDSEGVFAPALRDKAPPAVGKPTIGFRCAADADASRVSAVGERPKRAEVKEYVILSYKQILADLGKGEGDNLESLLQMLKIESEQRDEAIDKIRKLSEVYTVIPEFADRTIDLYAKAAVEPKPTPAAAPVTVTAQPATVKPPPGMVRIEGGEFLMGGHGAPVQRVRLSGFFVDESEVTQKAFQKATGFNPSKHRGADSPVDNVSWHNAKKYCEKAGKRLPTEAEWEYAARAGTTTRYFFGDKGSLLPQYANLCGEGCVSSTTWADLLEKDANLEVAPVKSLEPNPWGLYDVYGNVAEWVGDWYGPYGGGSMENPTGPPDGWQKVLRGGSWTDFQGGFAPALRDKAPPAVGKPGIGFRCAADAE